MYRSTGPNGEPVLSDRPSPGAVPVQVDVAPPVSGSSARSGTAYSAGTKVDDKEPFRYANCEITNPTNDQTFVNVQSVMVGARLEPTQRPGDTVILVVDGKRLDSQANALSWRLDPVFRGSHTVNVVVADPKGFTVCQSPGVTFNVRQPSIITPNPKGTVKKAPTTRRP